MLTEQLLDKSQFQLHQTLSSASRRPGLLDELSIKNGSNFDDVGRSILTRSSLSLGGVQRLSGRESQLLRIDADPRSETMPLTSYTPKNGYVPQQLMLRQQLLFDDDVSDITKRGYQVPPLVQKGAMLRTDIEGIVDQYYSSAVAPKQGILGHERGALSDLKMAMGIGGRFGGIPMTNDAADKAKVMMQYQMIDNDLSKGVFAPQLAIPPPPPPAPPSERGPQFRLGGRPDDDGNNGDGRPPGGPGYRLNDQPDDPNAPQVVNPYMQNLLNALGQQRDNRQQQPNTPNQQQQQQQQPYRMNPQINRPALLPRGNQSLNNSIRSQSQPAGPVIDRTKVVGRDLNLNLNPAVNRIRDLTGVDINPNANVVSNNNGQNGGGSAVIQQQQLQLNLQPRPQRDPNVAVIHMNPDNGPPPDDPYDQGPVIVPRQPQTMQFRPAIPYAGPSNDSVSQFQNQIVQQQNVDQMINPQRQSIVSINNYRPPARPDDAVVQSNDQPPDNPPDQPPHPGRSQLVNESVDTSKRAHYHLFARAPLLRNQTVQQWLDSVNPAQDPQGALHLFGFRGLDWVDVVRGTITLLRQPQHELVDIERLTTQQRDAFETFMRNYNAWFADVYPTFTRIRVANSSSGLLLQLLYRLSLLYKFLIKLHEGRGVNFGEILDLGEQLGELHEAINDYGVYPEDQIPVGTQVRQSVAVRSHHSLLQPNAFDHEAHADLLRASASFHGRPLDQTLQLNQTLPQSLQSFGPISNIPKAPSNRVSAVAPLIPIRRSRGSRATSNNRSRLRYAPADPDADDANYAPAQFVNQAGNAPSNRTMNNDDYDQKFVAGSIDMHNDDYNLGYNAPIVDMSHESRRRGALPPVPLFSQPPVIQSQRLNPLRASKQLAQNFHSRKQLGKRVIQPPVSSSQSLDSLPQQVPIQQIAPVVAADLLDQDPDLVVHAGKKKKKGKKKKTLAPKSRQIRKSVKYDLSQVPAYRHDDSHLRMTLDQRIELERARQREFNRLMGYADEALGEDPFAVAAANYDQNQPQRLSQRLLQPISNSSSSSQSRQRVSFHMYQPPPDPPGAPGAAAENRRRIRLSIKPPEEEVKVPVKNSGDSSHSRSGRGRKRSKLPKGVPEENKADDDLPPSYNDLYRRSFDPDGDAAGGLGLLVNSDGRSSSSYYQDEPSIRMNLLNDSSEQNIDFARLEAEYKAVLAQERNQRVPVTYKSIGSSSSGVPITLRSNRQSVASGMSMKSNLSKRKRKPDSFEQDDDQGAPSIELKRGKTGLGKSTVRQKTLPLGTAKQHLKRVPFRDVASGATLAGRRALGLEPEEAKELLNHYNSTGGSSDAKQHFYANGLPGLAPQSLNDAIFPPEARGITVFQAAPNQMLEVLFGANSMLPTSRSDPTQLNVPIDPSTLNVFYTDSEFHSDGMLLIADPVGGLSNSATQEELDDITDRLIKMFRVVGNDVDTRRGAEILQLFSSTLLRRVRDNARSYSETASESTGNTLIENLQALRTYVIGMNRYQLNSDQINLLLTSNSSGHVRVGAISLLVALSQLMLQVYQTTVAVARSLPQAAANSVGPVVSNLLSDIYDGWTFVYTK